MATHNVIQVLGNTLRSHDRTYDGGALACESVLAEALEVLRSSLNFKAANH